MYSRGSCLLSLICFCQLGESVGIDRRAETRDTNLELTSRSLSRSVQSQKGDDKRDRSNYDLLSCDLLDPSRLTTPRSRRRVPASEGEFMESMTGREVDKVMPRLLRGFTAHRGTPSARGVDAPFDRGGRYGERL